MKINYSNILKKNMINVFKDVLKSIQNNGINNGHHLYITFKTNSQKVVIPKWLKEKYPKEMTIVIQYEFWNLKVENDYFKITLSFNNINADLVIPFNKVISFADPYANFGLKLSNSKTNNTKKDSEKIEKKKKNNVLEFKKFIK
tara:strand:+ start:701 stop:1132 length:432 start_codon:yes stop_codon:yes gene_type:complete